MKGKDKTRLIFIDEHRVGELIRERLVIPYELEDGVYFDGTFKISSRDAQNPRKGKYIVSEDKGTCLIFRGGNQKKPKSVGLYREYVLRRDDGED